MRIDDRVKAQLAVFMAKSWQKVAELEAQEKATPNTTQTSHTRLHLARKLKGARTLANSWAHVIELTDVDEDTTERDGLDKEFPS